MPDNEAVKQFVGKPRRLAHVFQQYDSALYFITTNTAKRQALLANEGVHQAFRNYAIRNATCGRAIGRYVIMPDHLHFFVCLGCNGRLVDFVRLLKQRISQTLKILHGPMDHYWQSGFFDHLLRSSESYRQKWEYVAQNPIRAGLVERTEEWPYQGEIVRLERRS
jgi:putative transposase